MVKFLRFSNLHPGPPSGHYPAPQCQRMKHILPTLVLQHLNSAEEQIPRIRGINVVYVILFETASGGVGRKGELVLLDPR